MSGMHENTHVRSSNLVENMYQFEYSHQDFFDGEKYVLAGCRVRMPVLRRPNENEGVRLERKQRLNGRKKHKVPGLAGRLAISTQY